MTASLPEIAAIWPARETGRQLVQGSAMNWSGNVSAVWARTMLVPQVLLASATGTGSWLRSRTDQLTESLAGPLLIFPCQTSGLVASSPGRCAGRCWLRGAAQGARETASRGADDLVRRCGDSGVAVPQIRGASNQGKSSSARREAKLRQELDQFSSALSARYPVGAAVALA